MDLIPRLLFPGGGLYYIVAHNHTWRNYMVKRKVLLPPEPIPYSLPEINRDKFFQRMTQENPNRIILIEGPQGTGKTSATRSFLLDQYRKGRPVIYLSLRKIGEKYYDLDYHALANHINYIGAGLMFTDYTQTISSLANVIKSISHLRPIIAMDDAHVCFKQSDEWMRFRRNIMGVCAMAWADENIAQPIFISSDHLMYSKMRGMTGMRSRLNYIPFPEMTQEEFLDYIIQNKEFFNKKIPGDEAHLREQFTKFYSYFEGNLRDLDSFMKSQKKFKEYIADSIDGGIQDLVRALNDQHHAESKELLRRVARYDNVTLESYDKTNILNILINNNILLISQDYKILFQKPLFRYAFLKFYV